MDVFDRSILSYHIGWTCTAEQALRALQRAVAQRQPHWAPGVAPVIRTDNGPQFTAQVWAAGVEAWGLVHERIPHATPNRNAHIESWHSVLEAECLGNQVFHTLAEAYEAIARWITFYNERRMHGSLQDWPPAQFYAWALKGMAPPIPPVRC
ncbi:transposase [Sulfobacillus acidophilus TPY]|nr:transposase [Sulfobacillus acidophilus TPY]